MAAQKQLELFQATALEKLPPRVNDLKKTGLWWNEDAARGVLHEWGVAPERIEDVVTEFIDHLAAGRWAAIRQGPGGARDPIVVTDGREWSFDL